MSSEEQLAALQPPPRKYRKVVFSTNVAETSVTIEGIVFVVDSCFSKLRVYNPMTGLDGLTTAPISKASDCLIKNWLHQLQGQSEFCQFACLNSIAVAFARKLHCFLVGICYAESWKSWTN